jgi:SnoaL-like protein
MRGKVWMLAAVVGACVSRPITPRGAVPTAAELPGDVQALVRLALTLDAAADRAADTLYAPDALVVANARARLAAPRFAGVSLGGRITVAGATVTVEGRFAWAIVDYGWVDVARRLTEGGRATFVCERRQHGWKIVHVHSSQLLPWER